MRRLIPLLLILAGLVLAAPASAQEECDPYVGCGDEGSDFSIVPVGPPTCPFGGILITIFDQKGAACNGAPGAPGPAGANGAPGAAGAPGTSVTLPAFTPNPVQVPECKSRRYIWKRLWRWREGVRVVVWQAGTVRRTTISETRELLINLTGKPCGLYVIVVCKARNQSGHSKSFRCAPGFKKVKLWYLAGPNGSLTGINL